MNPVIQFQSRLFDLTKEPTNPFGSVHGVSLLQWLRAQAASHLDMTEPAAEDWGWYSHTNLQSRTYLVGAYAKVNTDQNHTWTLEIQKLRSIKERLMGQAKMAADDPCVSYFYALIRQEAAFTDIVIHP